MTNITMDHKTRDYIVKKGGSITIEKKKSGNC